MKVEHSNAIGNDFIRNRESLVFNAVHDDLTIHIRASLPAQVFEDQKAVAKFIEEIGSAVESIYAAAGRMQA